MELPDKYVNRIRKQLGEQAEEYFACFSERRRYGLRVNTKKISVEDFLKLSPFELEPVPWTDNGFYYDPDRYHPAKHPFYATGLYYLQEPSAMAPAAMLPVKPGDHVLDMCAAPGGKTTELGARLSGTGTLYANDLSASRARALLRNLELFGITNSVVTAEPPEKYLDRAASYFDSILIDAPCSGEGMFRKDSAIIKAWEADGPETYSPIQRNLLITGTELLKPGGYLLYSTCTFSPQEDEQTVEYLLNERDDMSLVPLPMYDGLDTGHQEWTLSGKVPGTEYTRRFWPHRIGGEGHFLALFRKSEDADPGTNVCRRYMYKKAELTSEAKEFLACLEQRPDPSRIEEHEGKLYYAAEDLLDLRGMRILRSGLYLGENRKKRFEPSEPLALAAKGFNPSVNLRADDVRVEAFLRGESIDLSDDEYSRDFEGRIVLVTVEGFGAGFGKLLKGRVKNRIPAGWRRS